ncbi:hypothetical protein VYA_43330 (plasmid) [Vibrio alfacsensis]|nr:hypothetical protein [Vibrio sp. 04Ya108]BCN24798.1 hypothetical protein VYA_19900 [Vibrio alfacsensis]BCN27141.1 hypothetical protein VYA_43330 [Vibrio alfacsensis]
MNNNWYCKGKRIGGKRLEESGQSRSLYSEFSIDDANQCYVLVFNSIKADSTTE